MGNNLTMAELDRAINSIPKGSDIIGFNVHPADLWYICEQVKVSYADHARYVISSYGGLSLYPDISIPRGLSEPVRQKTVAIK